MAKPLVVRLWAVPGGSDWVPDLGDGSRIDPAIGSLLRASAPIYPAVTGVSFAAGAVFVGSGWRRGWGRRRPACRRSAASRSTGGALIEGYSKRLTRSGALSAGKPCSPPLFSPPKESRVFHLTHTSD